MAEAQSTAEGRDLPLSPQQVLVGPPPPSNTLFAVPDFELRPRTLNLLNETSSQRNGLVGFLSCLISQRLGEESFRRLCQIPSTEEIGSQAAYYPDIWLFVPKSAGSLEPAVLILLAGPGRGDQRYAAGRSLSNSNVKDLGAASAAASSHHLMTKKQVDESQ